MPTYDYKCLVCENEFETIQSIKDEPHAPCPSCKVECNNRLISGGTAFVLKGGGWAADNYGSKKS
jgi:putative FmdB family regulatory protein